MLYLWLRHCIFHCCCGCHMCCFCHTLVSAFMRLFAPTSCVSCFWLILILGRACITSFELLSPPSHGLMTWLNLRHWHQFFLRPSHHLHACCAFNWLLRVARCLITRLSHSWQQLAMVRAFYLFSSLPCGKLLCCGRILVSFVVALIGECWTRTSFRTIVPSETYWRFATVKVGPLFPLGSSFLPNWFWHHFLECPLLFLGFSLLLKCFELCFHEH
jgi:hypothetical protein